MQPLISDIENATFATNVIGFTGQCFGFLSTKQKQRNDIGLANQWVLANQ